jgi:threonine/homoserine/homoserine lactone efflux protein
MTSPFIDGLIAGYGISIPLGAIAVLLISQAMEKGLRSGLWAAAGIATVDFSCAVIAVVAGQAVSSILEPYARPLQVISGIVLIAMGIYIALGAWRQQKADLNIESNRSTYFRFILLTAVNPFTVVYFTALIIGNPNLGGGSPVDGLLFALGVGFASITWQSMLAGVGAAAKATLPRSFLRITTVAGGALVVVLGALIMIG